MFEQDQIQRLKSILNEYVKNGQKNATSFYKELDILGYYLKNSTHSNKDFLVQIINNLVP